MQRLPIGIQTFARIRNEDRLYVDKTELIHSLVTRNTVYFLSRPRRFGKSLLVSTLAALFEGRRDLFTDLWIDRETDYAFESYPVIKIDFSQTRIYSRSDLEDWIIFSVDAVAQQWDIELTYQAADGRFAELIQKLGQNSPVVILIDEYDKPLLDNMHSPALPEIQEALKGFYTALKAADPYLRFVFLTGITKFAKVAVFSALNNLQDISIEARYGELLGITQTELETYFADRIDALAQIMNMSRTDLLEQIRFWYNGYRFSTKAAYVYNPFSLLLLFEREEFGYHWYETGTPSFLVELIKQNPESFHHMTRFKVSERTFRSYELDEIDPVALLFQTGYLTIKDIERQVETRYQLDFPNYEVKSAFLDSLLSALTELTYPDPRSYLDDIIRYLRAGEVDPVLETLKFFFANVPYDLQVKHERYYQTIFYIIFQLIGVAIQAEVRTNRGRIDAVVETADRVYLFEFKLFDSAESALDQIKSQGYSEKYQGGAKSIILVGAAFDPEQRNIGEWLSETL